MSSTGFHGLRISASRAAKLAIVTSPPVSMMAFTGTLPMRASIVSRLPRMNVMGMVMKFGAAGSPRE